MALVSFVHNAQLTKHREGLPQGLPPMLGLFARGQPFYEVNMIDARRPRARSSLPKPKQQTVTVPHWRKTTNYRHWRSAVLDRDDHCCQFCASRKNLTAHHIVSAMISPELRYEVRNGITLCRNCHNALEKAQGTGLLPRCCGSCPFVQIINVTNTVRSTGDRRKIKQHFNEE